MLDKAFMIRHQPRWERPRDTAIGEVRAVQTMLSFTLNDVNIRASAILNCGRAPEENRELLYRVPDQLSLDGNTVEMDRERAAFADNSVLYQASQNFLTSGI